MSQDENTQDINQQQTRFQRDRDRMEQGHGGELGYVLMDRQYEPDAAIVYDSHDVAVQAMDHDILVDSLAQEDCLECWVPDTMTIELLTDREIILANHPDGSWEEFDEE